MVGKTIVHYKILDKLGEGGMGIVYKAHDTKLDRIVALKFLPAHLGVGETEKQRFLREARAASSLDHSNICSIYSIEETEDGGLFITMAFYEGMSLTQRIGNGPLPIKDVLNFSVQIASGLQKAHEKGIVHRDLKPSNILITNDNQVKIIDFGLAKAIEHTALTKAGSTLGTVPYMSPEQAQGHTVDHRTDIWSLGIIMYEMVTGQHPFRSEYETALIYSIINQEPDPVTGLRSGVPMDLERFINKCLEKDMQDRYQRVDELIVDLRRIEREMSSEMQTRVSHSVQSETGLPHLAVLPFMSIKSNPETEFLGFALADQVISALTYLKNILVRPSSVIRKYQNSSTDPLNAGKDLHVDFILMGYYLKEAEFIRLNVELVNTHTSDMIWRESVEVKYENAFKLQDIISEKVIHGLEIQFSKNERDRIRADVAQDPLAYEFYLRSKSYPSTIDGDRIAIKILEHSIQLDPGFAPAWVELGYRYHRLASYASGEFDMLKKAREAFERALSINPELLNALSGLTILYTEIGNMAESVTSVHKALEINPNNSYTYFSLSYIYRYTGLLDESKHAAERALSLDPYNPQFRSLGNTYFYLGEYKRACEIYDLDKGSTYSFAWQGAAHFRQAKRDDALQYCNRVITIEPDGLLGLWSRGVKAYIEGKTEEGLAVISWHEKLIRFDGESWYHNASLYALFGNTGGCNRSLRKAIESGFFNYPFMIKDSFLESMADDPEFQKILATAKEKYENFKNDYINNTLINRYIK
jgi:eukaryotic-like serine/threonine-protein kinase